MAIISFTNLIWLTVTYISFKLYRSWFEEKRFQRFAKEHGCLPPPHAPASWIPWGIHGLFRVINAVKLGLDVFDDVISKRFREIGPPGCLTYQSTGLGGKEMIDTIDPRNIQTILSTNFNDWELGYARAQQFGVVLGKSIFTSDGSEWSHHRGVLRPSFNSRQMNDLTDMEKAAQDYLAVLPKAESKEDSTSLTGRWTDTVDLVPLNYRYTLDITTAFLLGENIGSQLAAAGMSPSDHPASEALKMAADLSGDMNFNDAFTTAQNWMGMRIRMQGFYWVVNGRAYKKATRYIQRFADFYVQQALKRQHTGREAAGEVSKERGNEPDTTKQRYSFLSDMVTQTQDPIEMRDQTLAVLVAGRDTTANLLSWTLLELARNSRVVTTLRNAIIDSYGSNAHSSTLTTASLRACRYLQHCMNEALRLHPVVPINNRFAVRDTVLPAGGGSDGSAPIAVKKGQLCNMMMYTIGRRAEVWGEDVLQFRPERWEDRKVGWDYIPFSAGPRVCMGQQMALTEAAYLLVRLLQTFDRIEWMGPEGKPKNGFGVTLTPGDGTIVRFRYATSSS